MKKELLKAIKNTLDVRVDVANNGMLARKKNNISDIRILHDNNVEIFFGYYSKGFNGKHNVVVQNGVIIAKIEPRHSTRKVNGAYKMLKPIVKEV